MYENRQKDMELVATKASFEATQLFDEIIDISNYFTSEEELTKLVRTEYENPYEMFVAYQEYPVFMNYLRHYNKLLDVRLHVTNESMYTNSKIIINHPKIIKEDWYNRALEHPNQLFWVTLRDPLTQKKHLSLVKNLVIDDIEVGVLTLYLNPTYLDNIFKNNKMNFLLYIDDELVYTKQNYATNMIVIKENKNNIMSIDHELDLSTSSINNIKMVTYLPRDLVAQQVQGTLYFGYFIIFLSFGLSFILIEYFIKTFNQRILMLQSSMAKVAKEDFDIPEKIDGNDELSDTYNFLYTTMLSLKKMIKEKYVHQIQKQNWKIRHQESEFKRLSSQINPHFLYNSLETIRMQALMQGNKEVAESVKILSRLLQKSLHQEKKIVSLKEELEFITLYLKMQQLRFGDRFTYEITYDDTIIDEKILSMIIQPIVENSFIHGIEGKSGPGHIEILIKIQNNNIVITIIDDGLGIEKEQLQIVKKLLKETSSTHIGLSNIQQRIELFYGENYGLSINSILNVGTKVVIVVPKIGSDYVEE